MTNTDLQSTIEKYYNEFTSLKRSILNYHDKLIAFEYIDTVTKSKNNLLLCSILTIVFFLSINEFPIMMTLIGIEISMPEGLFIFSGYFLNMYFAVNYILNTRREITRYASYHSILQIEIGGLNVLKEQIKKNRALHTLTNHRLENIRQFKVTLPENMFKVSKPNFYFLVFSSIIPIVPVVLAFFLISFKVQKYLFK